MFLNKILLWVLNNPVLLGLQDFFVSPVLKKMPISRYRKIRYKKSILFKISCIGAGTLTSRYLVKKNIDLSLRYACEIVSNQGYSFYSQHWKVYILYVGLIQAYKEDYEQAAIWLAEGVSKQKNSLFNLIMTQSYPEDFVVWLTNNIDTMTTVDGWQLLFSQARTNEKDKELLLIYISIFILALKLSELVVNFFDVCQIKHHSDWKKMIVCRQNNVLQSQYAEELTKQEIWHGTYTDIAQKLAINVLHKTFSMNNGASLQHNDDFKSLVEIKDYQHVSHRLFPLIMNSFHLVNRSEFSEAIMLLKNTVENKKDLFNSLGSRSGPTKVFLAGFGWSGSSAVYDACRAYPHTKDMPGAGDMTYLNVGADSEPMLHQGPGSTHNFINELKSHNHIPQTVLKMFFKNYVLLMPSYTYQEYKLVNANWSIIKEIGFDYYYLLICEFIYKYAIAMHKKDQTLAVDAIESFQENIVNSMFLDDDIVFFNNSIFAHRAKILNNIRGRSYYVVVNRNMSDQFCDQMRSNKFFNARFIEFYLVKLSRVISYKLAKKSSKNKGVEFVDIMFESWIQDASLREKIARKIFNAYDKEIELRYFNPLKSQKNINISRDHLCLFDKTCLKILQKTGLSI